MDLQERTFDRVVKFDEKSREYPVRTVTPDLTPRSFQWRMNLWLDQGREGACVGFSCSHAAATRPIYCKGFSNQTAREVYLEAKRIDEWDGEDYEGTSVLAGAKVMKNCGYISSYRWAFGLEDLILSLSHVGPAVLGLNWYENMDDVDHKGYVHAEGEIVGGHAIACIGVNMRSKRFTLHNSWGKDWGRNGRAYLSFDDMDRLLHEQGEACIPIK